MRVLAALLFCCMLSSCAATGLDEQILHAEDPAAWAALTPEKQKEQIKAFRDAFEGATAKEKMDYLVLAKEAREAQRERAAAIASLGPREKGIVGLIDAARSADVDQVSAEFTRCTREKAREYDRPSASVEAVAEQAIAACFPQFEWFVRGRAMSVAGLATSPSFDELTSYADYEVHEQRVHFKKRIADEVTASRAGTRNN